MTGPYQSLGPPLPGPLLPRRRGRSCHDLAAPERSREGASVYCHRAGTPRLRVDIKPAAPKTDHQQRARGAFTIIEVLVVIAVLAILAAMLLPTGGPRRAVPRIPKAKIELAGISSAIRDYELEYGRFPVSDAVMSAATNVPASSGGPEDATYGLAFLASQEVLPIAPVSTPNQTNNSEVIAILMDREKYGNGAPTVNAGHRYNPRRTPFLNANFVGDTKSPGVGLDGCYRDPWGTPYIITMDLNGDGKARDAFYRYGAVSADPTDKNMPQRGLNGLIPTVLNGTTVYEADTAVMVWSAGPDKKVQPGGRADLGANKDNILSWNP